MANEIISIPAIPWDPSRPTRRDVLAGRRTFVYVPPLGRGAILQRVWVRAAARIPHGAPAGATSHPSQQSAHQGRNNRLGKLRIISVDYEHRAAAREVLSQQNCL